MDVVRLMGRACVSLAALGLFLPESASALGPVADPAPGVADVALLEGGVLWGMATSAEGSPLPNVAVSLREQGREIALARTDAGGYFAFGSLRGGVYQLAAGEGQSTYRLWSPGTAPPGAPQGVIVVPCQDTVRGQYGGALRFWLSNPIVLGGVVATAVAVPLALQHHKRPTSP